ncbi:MAG: MarR family transcriptional regulator [Anaerolineae bacterium]|nr:MarR family transcriptional regulator [Anaerolineae bacterium]
MCWKLPCGVRTWLRMGRIITKLGSRLAGHLEAYELTPAQFDVLVQLYTAPNILQQELADRLFVTKGNVVGLLNRMECAGLVERCSHPEDGRAHLVRLTERGAQLAAQVVPEHEQLIEKQMTRLSPSELESLNQLLRKLNQRLGDD